MKASFRRQFFVCGTEIQSFFVKGIDKSGKMCYNNKANTETELQAGMAELVDARDLKSREILSRAGSIPVSGTISRGRAAW